MHSAKFWTSLHLSPPSSFENKEALLPYSIKRESKRAVSSQFLLICYFTAFQQ
jgi:hypothetical protein